MLLFLVRSVKSALPRRACMFVRFCWVETKVPSSYLERINGPVAILKPRISIFIPQFSTLFWSFLTVFRDDGANWLSRYLCCPVKSLRELGLPQYGIQNLLSEILYIAEFFWGSVGVKIQIFLYKLLNDSLFISVVDTLIFVMWV